MIRYQLIHQLNNTELGKTGMADCYINVTKNLDLSTLLAVKRKFSMQYAKNSKNYNTFRYEVGSEQRIYGFGQFFRDEKLNAGDLIIIDFFPTGFILNAVKHDNLVMLLKQGNSGLLQILNPERITPLGMGSSFTMIYNGSYGTASLDFNSSRKKRADAKSATDFYTMSFQGARIDDTLPGDRYYKLYKAPSFVIFSQTNKDKLITITY